MNDNVPNMQKIIFIKNLEKESFFVETNVSSELALVEIYSSKCRKKAEKKL